MYLGSGSGNTSLSENVVSVVLWMEKHETR